MPKPPVIESINTLARTNVFTIEQLDLQFSNGEKRQYERIKDPRSDAILVVPIIDEEHFCLILEYAAGTERYELGFPKGLIEQGETPEQASNRELQEEAGFAAKKLTYIKRLSMAPGYFQHQIHVVLAEGLYPQKKEGDEPEEIEVIKWPWKKMDSLLQREDFSEARSIAALFWVKAYLKKE